MVLHRFCDLGLEQPSKGENDQCDCVIFIYTVNRYITPLHIVHNFVLDMYFIHYLSLMLHKTKVIIQQISLIKMHL